VFQYYLSIETYAFNVSDVIMINASRKNAVKAMIKNVL